MPSQVKVANRVWEGVAGGKGENADEGWQRLVVMHSEANGNDNNI